jgi:excisionase family DNA binding protein
MTELLTEKEACKLLRCSRWTLWRHRKAGRIPFIRHSKSRNGKVYYDKARLEDWLNAWMVEQA